MSNTDTTTAHGLEIVAYTVTLDTPHGVGQLDLKSSLGPEAAGRRACISAVAIGWGDIDEVSVTDVTICTDWVD